MTDALEERQPAVSINGPVADWSTDYDIFDPGYVAEPYPVWDELRQACPIAHTERWGGSWLPTRYDDVARDRPRRRALQLAQRLRRRRRPSDEGAACHSGSRRSPPTRRSTPGRDGCSCRGSRTDRVAQYEPLTRDLCRRARSTSSSSAAHGDAAVDYAQQIPVRVIAGMLGVPADLADTFTGWVRDVLEFAHDEERRRRGRNAHPDLPHRGDGSVAGRTRATTSSATLLHTEVDGAPGARRPRARHRRARP